MSEIPVNHQILAEAKVDSLGDLFSRDPEGYSRQDEDRVIAELRAQRQRLADAERAGPVKKPSKAGTLLAKVANPGELDL